MVRSCSAPNCESRANKGNKIPFYHLPVDKDRRMKWIKFLNRKNLPKLEYVLVCGRHFKSGCKSNDKLNPDFIPSISLSSLSSKRASPKKMHIIAKIEQRNERHKRLLLARVTGNMMAMSSNLKKKTKTKCNFDKQQHKQQEHHLQHEHDEQQHKHDEQQHKYDEQQHKHHQSIQLDHSYANKKVLLIIIFLSRLLQKQVPCTMSMELHFK